MRGAPLLSIVVALGATLLSGGVASAAGHVVRITSTLDPVTITIAAGDRVTWRNDDRERHRIRSRSGPGEFDSGNLEPGETFRVTLTRVGRYEYYDHRNDEQTSYYGTVIVREASTSDGGDGGGDGGAGDPGNPATPDAPDASAPSRATIDIGDRIFRPRNVTIATGGSVAWRNGDDREHTATGEGGAFDTGILSPGETARAMFPRPGTFSFLCLIHPDMTGMVTVVDAATTGSGGGSIPATPDPSTSDPADPAEPSTRPDPGVSPSAPSASPAGPATAAPGVDDSAAAGGTAGGGVGTAGAGASNGEVATTRSSASRDIGAVLLALAALGGMVLVIRAGIGALRLERRLQEHPGR